MSEKKYTYINKNTIDVNGVEVHPDEFGYIETEVETDLLGNKHYISTETGNEVRIDESDVQIFINQNGTAIAVGTAVVVGGIIVGVMFPEVIPALAIAGRTLLSTLTKNAGKNSAGEITKKAVGSNFDKIAVTSTGVLVGTTTSFAEAEALTINRPPVDPLILDLDGDGIETTTIGDGIYFDHETDGFAEKTSWTGNNDVIMFDKYYIKQTA